MKFHKTGEMDFPGTVLEMELRGDCLPREWSLL
jgi:hypothetical protein